MTRPRFIGVIEISKTEARVASVDLDARTAIAARTLPGSVLHGAPYPHFDTEATWAFVCDSLAELNREHPLDALSVAAHGACAALVDETGALSLPVLDYEYPGPETLLAEYNSVRPDWLESFTPRLPDGLNLGAQLFWQARCFPEPFARTKWILPYPQYWSYRLTGVPSSETTSLGCHTDLWNFQTDLYSSLVMRQEWLEKMPDVHAASDILGTTAAEVSKRLGLARPLPVCAGMNAANASLLAHQLNRDKPFAVVSTGTWVVVYAPGGDLEHLNPARDTLANIDALGRHVPSARFMGGREFEALTGGVSITPSQKAIARVLAARIMLLPSVTEGSGPFPHSKARWTTPQADLDSETLYTVVSFYLALMTAECLALTGAEGDIVVEGPFARNECFVAMLGAAAGRAVEPNTANASGAILGAAMLARMEPDIEAATAAPRQPSALMAAYARAWRAEA